MRYVLILILSVIFFYMNGVSIVYAENEEEKNEYDFNESEFEKKPFTFSGYVELFPSLYIADRQSALYRLKYYKEGPGNPNADAYLRIQPEATFEKGIFKAFIRAYETFGYSNHQWPFDLRLYEGYITLKPNQHIIIDAGKKTLKWGKGYAWNPVAFIDRPKNPDDPDLSYEGYTVASADFIASFTGPLKTISFTPVVLPVYNKLNDSFGKSGHWNFAGRLYLLFYDTDIDFIFIAGTNKISNYGIDLSRNITKSFEIHGECAVIPGYKKRHLSDIGLMRERTITAVSALAGIRYLTEIETT